MTMRVLKNGLLAAVVASCTLALGAGCGGGEGEGDGGDEGDAAEGEGEEGEGEEGEGDGNPPPEDLGTHCEADTDCDDFCGNSLLGTGGYCTTSCTSDDDCVFADGSPGGCVPSQGAEIPAQCVKLCPTNHDAECGDNGACLPDVGLFPNPDDPEGPAQGICFIFAQRCDSDADCTEGSCVITSVGNPEDGIFGVCTVLEGEDVGHLAVGDPCDADALSHEGDPCNDDTDCPDTFTCETGTDGAKTCSAPPEASCANFVCWDQGVCDGACAADTDCPDGMRCEGFELAYNDAGDTDVTGLCRPFLGTATACAADGTCAGDEVCTVHPNLAGEAEAVCWVAPDGALPFGAQCDDDPTTLATVEPGDDCASDLCIEGKCTQTCNADGQCAGGQCITLNFGDSANPLLTGVCLSGGACTTDAECADDETCEAFVDSNGDQKTRCAPTIGTLAAGADCSAEFLQVQKLDGIACVDDSDCTAEVAGAVCNLGTHECIPPLADLCRSDICLSESGTCSSACSQDTDCPTDYICAGFDSPYDDGGTEDDNSDDLFGVVNLCVHRPGSRTACDQDSDCTTAGEICRLTGAKDTGAVASVCAAPSDAGFLENGASCGKISNGDDFGLCQSGLCFIATADGDTGKCTNVCTSDSDCRANTTCQDFPADLLTNPAHTFKICR